MKAKELAEMHKRSQLEFLAYVCHDLRNHLNSIIGGAQVIKDQLHGPMENRKYRQYATDIFTAGNALLNRTQDLVAMAKSETGYFELAEKPVDIADIINKSVRFISDKMQAESLGIKIQMHEPIPRLIADEFRLQQILTNLFLQVIDHAQPSGTIMLEALFISESRDKGIFAFIISSHEQPPHDNAALLKLADELMNNPPQRTIYDAPLFSNDRTNISLELARRLIALHDGAMDITESPDNSIAITVFFPGNRVRFMDSSGT
jgi:light-regulated signal transduction histidine kinase (bacteriophytochrome)